MKDVAGKVAVVTGAASGIGKAMALDFARRGMKLVGADIEEKALEVARGEIAAAGPVRYQFRTRMVRWPTIGLRRAPRPRDRRIQTLRARERHGAPQPPRR